MLCDLCGKDVRIVNIKKIEGDWKYACEECNVKLKTIQEDN